MISIIPLILMLLSVLVVLSAEFDPYVDNGGTIVAVAGIDYCIIASDTRLSESYLIKSRNIPRLFEVSLVRVFINVICL